MNGFYFINGALPVQTSMSRVVAMRLLAIVLIGTGLCVLVYFSPAFFESKENTEQVQMGGTSTMALLVQNGWGAGYRGKSGVTLDYESCGSTTGVTRLIDGKYSVAFTHAPIAEDQRQAARGKGGDVVQLPVVLCAVVPAYNLPSLKDKPPLNFSGEVLGDIFLGKITKWNDSALAKLNAGVALPDRPITVVHRKDSSGTTFLFTEYLQGASERWRAAMGPAGNTVKWPLGIGVERNQGGEVPDRANGGGDRIPRPGLHGLRRHPLRRGGE